MNRTVLRLMVLISILGMNACNLPGGNSPFNAANTATALAATLTALPAASPIQIPTSTATSMAIPTATAMPFVTAAPQDALVLSATLCWAGPGPVYEVVSGLKKGERVLLLGRGSISGWWVVENPIYHDPCWVMAEELQVDPTVNTAALQVFTPPPTPTPSYTPMPTATATLTATPTSTP